jgi:hypothetical protein
VKKYTYNFEVKDLLTQFAAAFDDIVIKRYNATRESKEEISVRYVLGPKERVMYDIVNKAQNLTLPVIAINPTSISRDSSRVFNKLDGFYNYKNEAYLNTIKTPVPINITVSVSILARYMQDMDQIVSNFIPYANPYIIISWKEPLGLTTETFEIRTEVLWDGNINLTSPTDLTYSDKFRITADTTFTIKGWLFKDSNVNYPSIYNVKINNITPYTGFDFNTLDDDSYSTKAYSLTADSSTDIISGGPIITNAFYTTRGSMLPVTHPITFNKQLTGNNSFLFYGTGLSSVTTVLLSSNNNTLTSGLTSLKCKSNVISGFKLSPSSYNIINDNLLSVNIPYLSGSGKVDILLFAPQGCFSTFSMNNFHFSDTYNLPC